MLDIKILRKERVILDYLPFLFNIMIIFQYVIPIELLSIYNNCFGFNLFIIGILYYRSKINNYCIWHRIPILNMLLICIFNIMNNISNIIIGYKLTQLSDSIILYYMYGIFIILFLVSSFMFIRTRRKCNNGKNCKYNKEII